MNNNEKQRMLPRFLYHGASQGVDGILKSGIVRRTDLGTASNWPDAASRDDLVYLTTYAHWFYGRAGYSLNVVEIDVDKLDPRLFLPDEDYLHQVKGVPISDAKNMLENYQTESANCLSQFGTCAYKGSIPLSAISKICTIKLNCDIVLKYFYEPFEIDIVDKVAFEKKGQVITAVTEWIFGHSQSDDLERRWGATRDYFITVYVPPAGET